MALTVKDVAVALASLVTLLLSILQPGVTGIPAGSPGQRFVVLVDAGSTSAKLKVYSLSQAADNEKTPLIQLVHALKKKPGIHELEKENITMTDYLSELVGAAKKHVPAAKQSETRIFVLATAGMRYLMPKDAAVILDEVSQLLSKETFSPFKFDKSNAQVLSGEEEAAYLWVAVNYLLGFFDMEDQSAGAAGVLEMGGGSTQIAFMPKLPLYQEEYSVQVMGRKYDLYVQSHFRFGINAMMEQLWHDLWTKHVNSNAVGNVDDPCALKEELKTHVIQPGATQFRGSGSFEDCKTNVDALMKIEDKACKWEDRCSLGTAYIPPLPKNTKWVLAGAFRFAAKALNKYKEVLNEDTKQCSMQKMKEAAKEHCSKTLSGLVDWSIKDKDYASSYCFAGAYYPSLLKAYKFDLEEEAKDSNLHCTGSINSPKFGDKEQDINWVLGAALLLAGSSTPCPPPPPTRKPATTGADATKAPPANPTKPTKPGKKDGEKPQFQAENVRDAAATPRRASQVWWVAVLAAAAVLW